MANVEYFPVVSAILFEWANANQLLRMWRERTSAGQSIVAWISVFVGLLLFVVYYRQKRMRIPFYTTTLSLMLCSWVCWTVVYFRWFA